MNAIDARSLLLASEDLDDAALNVLKIAASLIASGQYDDARDIVILSLNRINEFREYKVILDSLVVSTGLYPYLDPTELVQQSDLLSYEFHRPIGLGKSIVFHESQAEVYRRLLQGENTVLSAPTSFGKSLIIDALIASGRYVNIVIIVPTLALVDETRRRILGRFASTHRVITHAEQDLGKRNIFVTTQERIAGREDSIPADLLVIDEFYKLSSESTDVRFVLLNQAFYKFVRRGVQFYLLGPNIEDIARKSNTLEVEYHFFRTRFRTVYSNIQRVERGNNQIESLINLLHTLNGSTVIYCQSPRSAEEICRALIRVAAERQPFPAVLELSEWLAENYHPVWTITQGLKQGIGVHHGRLPRAIGQAIVRLFNAEKLPWLICTSTLIEGVNTAAKNVVVYDNKIGTTNLDFFTFSNIAGRSGRMWRHFVGNIFTFYDPPDRVLPFLEFPALHQDSETPEELLVQMDFGDLTPESKSRLSEVLNQDFLPVEIIQSLSGISPRKLIDLAVAITDLPSREISHLSWNGNPEYDQLKQVFSLAWQHLSVSGSFSVRSPNQLTLLTWRLRNNPNEGAFVNAQLVDPNRRDNIDDTIAKSLSFLRNWAGFRAPRLLQAVNLVQRHVMTVRGIKPGDYSWFAARLESRFMGNTVSALDEYGLPTQTSIQLINFGVISFDDTLDEALSKISNMDLRKFSHLAPFGRDSIRLLQHSTTQSDSA